MRKILLLFITVFIANKGYGQETSTSKDATSECGKPNIINVLPTATSITLTWSKVNNVDSYNIFNISKDKKDTIRLAETDTTLDPIQYTIDSLSPLTQYNIQIESVCLNHKSAMSDSYNVTTKHPDSNETQNDGSIPAADDGQKKDEANPGDKPKILPPMSGYRARYDKVNKREIITWDNVQGATSYHIFVRKRGGKDWLMKQEVATNNATFDNPEMETDYEYQVQSIAKSDDAVSQSLTGSFHTFSVTSIQGCNTCDDADNLIEYDFNCNRFFLPNSDGSRKYIDNLHSLKVKYNRALQFKVININRYIYDVNLQTNDVNYSSNPSPLFSQLFLGSGNLITSLISQIQTSSGKNLSSGEPGGNQSPIDAFLNELQIFKDMYDQLLDAQERAYDLCRTLPCCGENTTYKFSDVAGELSKLEASYITMTTYMSNKIKDTTKLQAERADLDEVIKTCVSKASIQSEIVNKLKPKAVGADKTFYITLIASLQQCHDDGTLTDDATSIGNCISAGIKQQSDNVNKASNNIKFLITLKKQIDQQWGNIYKITDQQLMKLVLFNDNLLADNDIYLSPPIFPQGNRLQITFDITPRDSALTTKMDIIPLKSVHEYIDLPVRCKAFVGFSVGTFLSWGGSLKTTNYNWQPVLPKDSNIVRDSTGYKLVKSQPTLPAPGIAAFANIGAKFSNNFGAGLSFGVGLPIQANPIPQYFLGGSLYIGDRQQVNLTCGATFTEVNFLDTSAYPTKFSSVVFAKQPPQIHYLSNMQVGMFLSLTYTIYDIGNTKNSGSAAKAAAAAKTASKPASTQTVNFNNYNNTTPTTKQGTTPSNGTQQQPGGN